MTRQRQCQAQGQTQNLQSSDEEFVVRDEVFEEPMQPENTENPENSEQEAQPDQGPIGTKAGEVVRSWTKQDPNRSY